MAFVLYVITTCKLALITKSCFFAVGVPGEAHHKRKMRWNWEKPHKNEHQSFQIYLFPPFLCSDNVGGWHIKSCSKANIPSTYQWAWNKYFESKHILWNSNWPSLLMGSNDVKLSMQSDLVFQLPGSDDSISMEKQENAKMKIHFFPPSFHAAWVK